MHKAARGCWPKRRLSNLRHHGFDRMHGSSKAWVQVNQWEKDAASLQQNTLRARPSDCPAEGWYWGEEED